MTSKELLRKKFYTLRKKKYFSINKEFFSPLIKFLKMKIKKKQLRLGLYYPISFEANVLKILELKIIDKHIISLPKIDNDKINFFEWNKNDILKVSKFGTLEPTLTDKPINPDIILVPLLAYDNKKNRLGYGKGFYDKYLNYFFKRNKDILTVGIAFSFQKYKKIPTSMNDIKLDNILTEKGII